MLQTKEVTVGPWRFNLSPERLELAEGMRSDITELVNSWTPAFNREKTYVWEKHNVPSLILVMKCSIMDGILRVYGISDYPDGVGVTTVVNPEFAMALSAMRKKWPVISLLSSPTRKGYDDNVLWLGQTEAAHARESSSLLLIQAEASEGVPTEFIGRSIAPVKYRGDREFGKTLHLWTRCSESGLSDFDWQKGFCLKPLRGNGSKNLIWQPNEDFFERRVSGGRSTRDRIAGALNARGAMYYQPFIRPMKGPDGNPMIYRLFFLYDPEEKRYQYEGGMWNSRPSFNVHGASDATFGQLE